MFSSEPFGHDLKEVLAEHENCGQKNREYIGGEILNCQLKNKLFFLQLNSIMFDQNFWCCPSFRRFKTNLMLFLKTRMGEPVPLPVLLSHRLVIRCLRIPKKIFCEEHLGIGSKNSECFENNPVFHCYPDFL